MTSTQAPTKRTWLITGAGRGLGKAFAQAALELGDHVIGTVRTPGSFSDLLAQFPDTARQIQLDVRSATDVARAVDDAAQLFGGLDIVINNAGTGFVGTLEEVTEDQARDHFDTNLFGAMWVSQAAIAHLRENGGGDIVQISTVGAIGSMPTMGLYNASKWALEGFSEALAGEVAQFGIRVTIAQLGGFATDWAGSSMPFATPDPRYDDLRLRLFGTADVPWPSPDPAVPSTDSTPALAASALIAHLANPNHPLRILIGEEAPGHAGLAYAARRGSYGTDSKLQWPS